MRQTELVTPALLVVAKSLSGYRTTSTEDVIKALVDRGANLNARDHNGDTALKVVIKHGDQALAEDPHWLRRNEYLGVVTFLKGLGAHE